MAVLEEQIAFLPEPAEVIVLPEMFNTGFSMNVKATAEVINTTTTRWLKMLAAQTGALVIGSMAVRDGKEYFNRLFCMRPDGTYEFYDKRHLFRMGAEQETFSAGKERLIVDWKGWRICPLVCYDLRFPVWSRQDQNNPYDVLLYVANWPAVRAYAWNTLLRARAIENLSYVVGVNRIGTDGNGVDHKGGSLAVDFLGDVITDLGEAETTKVVHLEKVPLEKYRRSFPAHLDADSFTIG